MRRHRLATILISSGPSDQGYTALVAQLSGDAANQVTDQNRVYEIDGHDISGVSYQRAYDVSGAFRFLGRQILVVFTADKWMGSTGADFSLLRSGGGVIQLSVPADQLTANTPTKELVQILRTSQWAAFVHEMTHLVQRLVRRVKRPARRPDVRIRPDEDRIAYAKRYFAQYYRMTHEIDAYAMQLMTSHLDKPFPPDVRSYVNELLSDPSIVGHLPNIPEDVRRKLVKRFVKFYDHMTGQST